MEESRGEGVLDRSVVSQQHRVRRTFGPAQSRVWTLNPQLHGCSLESCSRTAEMRVARGRVRRLRC